MRSRNVRRPLAALVFLVLPVVAGDAGAQPAGGGPPPGRGPERLEGRYIVVYRPSVDRPNEVTEDLSRRHGFRTTHRFRHALEGFSAALSEGQLKRLRDDPRVEFVARDRVVHALGAVPIAPGDTVPTGVRRIEAGSSTTVHQPSSVNVAVIDTGIDLEHPDLNAVNGIDCIGDGPADDGNGHGTHVAGTIGAKNNGSGVVGVAPGTKLYAVKVLNSNGSGTDSQVVCGIDWVTGTLTDDDPSNDIPVANMSLGGGGVPIEGCSVTTDPMHLAICRSTTAGVTHVVAAGNDAWDFDYPPIPDTPAAYPQALTVTAISDSDGRPGGQGGSLPCRSGEADDRYASYSNFALTDAGEAHTVAAPGTCITSTRNGGGTTTMSGTSMAAPHIAGLVALCMEEAGTPGPCADLTPAQIIDHIRAEAQGYNTTTTTYGFQGDPLRPRNNGEYYGYLGRVGLPPPDPAARIEATPTGTVVQKGTLRSGGPANLASDENSYYEVNSTSRRARTTTWYGSFNGIPNGLSDLTITYAGKNSLTCDQTVKIRHWSTKSWSQLDARPVGATEVRVVASPAGAPGEYVSGASGNGEVRVQVGCTTRAGTFVASGDLLQISYLG
ncbi:MAG TPA: S8 family serine peptidase [Actinomycetota bacterium]|nr:S8 family serine peptidase [Actinomycetota bacterium]